MLDLPIARHVARGASRGGLLWGLVFGIVVTSSVSGFAAAYPTLASRQQLARVLGGNAGIVAMFGPGHHIETVGGFAAWRSIGILTFVGGIWGVLAATRLIRGEEEAGRWELLLAGPTTRRRAQASALVGLASGLGLLFGLTAVMSAAIGMTHSARFAVSSSLFLAAALAAPAAVFLAIGALSGQLAATRRQAASLAGGAFGAAYLLRVVADSGHSLRWLEWLTPLGWESQMRPLTGSRPWLLLPVGVLVVVASSASVAIAGARDLGASVLPDRDHGPPHTRLLNSQLGLSARLLRPSAVGWEVGVAVISVVFGLVAESAGKALTTSKTVEQALARLGAHGNGAEAYLGLVFIIVSSLIALTAAADASATREEEADGHLDNLLTRSTTRRGWLAGRLGISVSALVLGGATAGLFAWAGATSQHGSVGIGRLLGAGLNTVPPAIFVLGVGTFVHAAVPRWTAVVSYGIVTWSFLLELIGSVIKANRWLLDLSLFHHVAAAPATDVRWSSVVVLAGTGLAAALMGAVVFGRRDIIAA